MKFIKTPVKGMCDMLPADMRMREHVLGMIKESYAKYGFMQIETPVMEHIENLTSKQGGDNEKLIFKVMKRGADLQRAIDSGNQEFADNGLRYDLTVPLASTNDFSIIWISSMKTVLTMIPNSDVPGHPVS